MTTVYSIRFHFASMLGVGAGSLSREMVLTESKALSDYCAPTRLGTKRASLRFDQSHNPHACRLLVQGACSPQRYACAALSQKVFRNGTPTRVGTGLVYRLHLSRQYAETNPHTFWLRLRGNRLGFISLVIRYKGS